MVVSDILLSSKAIHCPDGTAARSGHCTQGLGFDLPKQQFWSKAANTWLAEGTVMSKREKVLCCGVYDIVPGKKKCERIATCPRYCWCQNKKIILLYKTLGHHSRHCTSCSTNVPLKCAAK